MNFKQQHSLSALEIRLQGQNERFNALEFKASQYVSISGLVLTIITGFSLTQDNLTLAEQVIFTFTTLAFAFVFYHTLRALWPSDWEQPIELNQNWDNFISSANDTTYHQEMYDSYCKAIKHNDFMLNRKYRFVHIAGICLIFQLVFVFVTAFAVIWL